MNLFNNEHAIVPNIDNDEVDLLLSEAVEVSAKGLQMAEDNRVADVIIIISPEARGRIIDAYNAATEACSFGMEPGALFCPSLSDHGKSLPCRC